MRSTITLPLDFDPCTKRCSNSQAAGCSGEIRNFAPWDLALDIYIENKLFGG